MENAFESMLQKCIEHVRTTLNIPSVNGLPIETIKTYYEMMRMTKTKNELFVNWWRALGNAQEYSDATLQIS